MSLHEIERAFLVIAFACALSAPGQATSVGDTDRAATMQALHGDIYAPGSAESRSIRIAKSASATSGTGTRTPLRKKRCDYARIEAACGGFDTVCFRRASMVCLNKQ